MSASRFRLVDDFTAAYLKYQGREPRTLEELAIALADNEHKRRLAEIKAMARKLALLDELLPALAERGVNIWPREVSTYDQGKTLRLLRSLGEQRVTLKRGRALLITIDVKKAAAPAVAETAGAPS